ncbi:DUF6134 family protein [Algoriphagus sp. A40]|uniref:DUF6134 family protein n=1 Tax=Algoriphagus sp. A40 TaxID=1945863 RepID=UPI00098647AA|nr:DUF6134 family protein [Algoriphagus sp. A40]OOG74861.1 hypothetical protein B0E43_10790 [Algoriphagus sp. A40]
MTAGAAAKNFSLALVLFLSVGFWNPTFSQEKKEEIKFEITVLGMKIGDLDVTRYQVGDTLHYIAESKVQIWFFGKVDVEMFTHAKYVDGYFVKSLSRSNTNRGNFLTTIYWDGKKYVVDAKNYKFENQEPIIGKVEWSPSRLFFEELQEGKKFISEVYGLTTTIKKLEPNVYETNIPGNQNQYYYQFGKLQKAVLENSIKNFQYKRVK